MTKSSNTKSYTYQALLFSQRPKTDAPRFALFHAPAADIIEWADVERLNSKNRKGAQRPLRDLKVKKVKHFLDAFDTNTIPTAVVVALDKSGLKIEAQQDDNKAGQHGTITLTVKANGPHPGLIIDGQHRAFGMAKAFPSMHLSIVAFIGGDDEERAFQFIVINNTAARVKKNHVQALALQFKEDRLNERLLKSAGAGVALNGSKYDDFRVVDSMPPFKGLLDWPTNNSGFVPPNAIESALSETRQRANLLGVEDLELDFLLDIWSRIKHLRPDAWRAGSKESPSHLLEKVTIYALTVYILDSLSAASRMAEEPIDFTDIDVLHSNVDRIIKRIPVEFWTTPWQAKELDTSAGRQILLDALAAIDANVRYGKPWYESVSIIDPAVLMEQKKPAKKAAKRTKKAKKTK